VFVFCGHEAAGFDLENSRDEIPLKTFNFLIIRGGEFDQVFAVEFGLFARNFANIY
jgi:hypothetical protein